MTDDEIAEALAKLEALRRRAADGIHDILNILAIWKGEMDLVNQAARKVVDGLQRTLDEFYARFPEFRNGE